MESPKQEGSVARMLVDYIESHPDLKNEGFSPEEIRAAAAQISAKQESNVDEKLLDDALKARLMVRGASGKIAVMDGGNVIGTTESMGKAGEMYRGDAEAA